ncbi:MAG: hypothetical protein QOI98_2674 [Solirubrobacteraceae bacterium]|jgi:hypothetical protein|nr:hypothetical protein [Solirubrobacteraceae bacterium]
MARRALPVAGALLALSVAGVLMPHASRGDGTFAATAGHDPSFSATVTPRTLSWPGARRGTVSIQIETFDGARSIAIESAGPAWPDRDVVGSPLAYGSPRLEGPGELVSFAHGGGVFSSTACFRGQLVGSGGVTLTLPADTRTTLRIPVRLAAPPWRGTDYAPRFMAVFPYDGSQARPDVLRFRAPAFRVIGARGLRIRLASDLPRGRDRLVRVAAHERVRLIGTTDPVVRHARLWIGYRRPSNTGGRARSATIARVRTDGRGRFSLTWSPPRRGDYQLAANYASTQGSLVSDRTCALAVRAR